MISMFARSCISSASQQGTWSAPEVRAARVGITLTDLAAWKQTGGWPLAGTPAGEAS